MSLRIGLIGAGSIAAYHIDGVRAAGGEIAAVAAASMESAARAAARFGIPRACLWPEMIAGGGLDAVIVATPDDTHEEIAVAAIGAGLPCLVQKPLAPTAEAAARVADLARARGVLLGTSFMHRHLPETVAFRAMLEGPAEVRGLGRILSIRLRNATPGPDWGDWFYDPGRTGGVVMQLGVHGLDLIEHLFGPIAEVSALSAVRRPSRRLADGRVVAVRSPDHVLALHRLASGVVATHEILFGEQAGTDRFKLEATCEGGQIELRGARGSLAVNDGSGWRIVETGAASAGEVQHRFFLEALARGDRSDGTDAAGVQSVLAAEALTAAARKGRAVAVPRWRPAS